MPQHCNEMPQHCNEMPQHCNEMPQLFLSSSSAFPQHFSGLTGPYITTPIANTSFSRCAERIHSSNSRHIPAGKIPTLALS